MAKSLKGQYEEPPLASQETAKDLGLEALMARLEERESWADSIRLLWNEISPQIMTTKIEQDTRYMLCLKSTSQPSTDGEIKVLDLDGNEVTIQSAKRNRKGLRSDSDTIHEELSNTQKYRDLERNYIGKHMEKLEKALHQVDERLDKLDMESELRQYLEKEKERLVFFWGDLKKKRDA